ncbi:3-hydroxy-5-phosphonooxypentane-2,4-dione thiolase [subsurface metagenome]
MGKQGGFMLNLKEKRMQNIFNSKTGRTLMASIDHGLYMGAVRGIEHPVEVIKEFIECDLDGILISLGLNKISTELFKQKKALSKILTLDYILLSKIPGIVEEIFANCAFFSVEQAVHWGFDAVKVLLAWGTDKETQIKSIQYIAKIAQVCDKLQMPLMIKPFLDNKNIPKEKRKDPKVIIDASRIAVEMGADIIKIPYTGDKDSFAEIVNHSYVPVVIYGVPDMGTMKDLLQATKDSIDVGGKGIVFGMDVWQNNNRKKIIHALIDIIHKNKGIDEVTDKYNVN